MDKTPTFGTLLQSILHHQLQQHMPRIKKLPKHEAHKIAAGEVVERPSNIVKELLENAVDAGATKISLYIEDGGKKLIRIVDNGCGMDREDARLCFEKHATSKISSIDELDAIETFGFRGEALASVAAIAQVTLITKQDGSDEGVFVEVEHSEIINEEVVPATTGTDIAVRELFFNIPARKKFLKKKETEWRHIHQLFQAFCLDYPQIHFLLFSEGRNTLNCPPAATFADRCAQLWDHDTAKQLLPLTAQRETPAIQISGMISDHNLFRYDRSGIFFFVNKRWVKNNALGSALLKGYQNVIPPGRYPLAALSIEIDNALIDVNIHPRKEEVKFMNPRMVEVLIQEAVKKALEENLSSKINRDVSFAPRVETYAQSYAQTSAQPAPKATAPTGILGKFGKFFQASAMPNITEQAVLRDLEREPFDEMPAVTKTYGHKESAETKELPEKPVLPTRAIHVNDQQIKPQYRLIGQYHQTYLLIEEPDGLFLIDQHAAHERILYEQFTQNFENIPTITLLFPELITVSAEEKKQIEPHLHILQENGICVELFDDSQLIVRSTPVHLRDISIEALIKKMIADLNEMETVDQKDFFKAAHEKLRTQMACKAAIKAGDTLSREQMEKLLLDLYQTSNRFSCPHGRPTGWLLRLDEIEKKFKRDYKSYSPHTRQEPW
jgi:DNA mismatch repair protein MutL